VTHLQAVSLAEELNAVYIETSAKTGKNVISLRDVILKECVRSWGEPNKIRRKKCKIM